MMLKHTPSHKVKRCCATAILIALALSARSDAAILVGTIVTSSTETLTEINQLIDAYNADFNASLPSAESLVDKIEGQQAAGFVLGNLSLGDFQFFQRKSPGSVTHSIFDASVSFVPSSLGPSTGFDDLDNPTLGFLQLAGTPVQYYVSKDGSLGWSLWLAESGFNPVYTDAGTGPSSIAGSGFTRGGTAHPALQYDPITRGVSHVSFYRAGATAEIPEPHSAACLLAVLASLSTARIRRTRS